MSQPAGRVAGAPVEARAGWLRSLRTLYVLPEEFRSDSVDRATALRMLGCGEELLQELMAEGLRHSAGPDGPLFDWHDLHNLALYSGSGASQPERGMRFALRWMGWSPESWTAPAWWSFDVELSCARPHGELGGESGGRPHGESGGRPHGESVSRWLLAEPVPAVYGGELRVEASDAAGVEDGYLAGAGGGTFRYSAHLRTSGVSDRIRSTELAQIFATYSAPDYRWVRLPHALQVQTDRVLSQQAVTCVASSLDLAARCRAAGYPARTRIGWMLGLLDLRHAWVEVTDDDGTVKVADPVFGTLSRLATEVQPGFAEACLGTTFSRLLPTGLEADRPLTGHHCGDDLREPDRNIRIRMHEHAGDVA